MMSEPFQTSNCYMPEDASWFELNTYHGVQAGIVEPMHHGHALQPVADIPSDPMASWTETCGADNVMNGYVCGSNVEARGPVSFCVQPYAPVTPADTTQSYRHSDNASLQPPDASSVTGSVPFDPTNSGYDAADTDGASYSLAFA
ncbi:hypothetical protein MANI_023731 [Metarhizium anisopliae]|nr:hypothetical protein MANI_023731 [Metarhizium anisopliae]